MIRSLLQSDRDRALVHGGVELDQRLAGLDRLPVMHMDGANHAGLERLDQLGAAARDDLALREATMSTWPKQAQTSASANTAMMVRRSRGRRGDARRFDDLERGRQKGELFAVAPVLS